MGTHQRSRTVTMTTTDAPKMPGRTDANRAYVVTVNGPRYPEVKPEHAIAAVKAFMEPELFYPKTDWWQLYVRDVQQRDDETWFVHVVQDWLD